MPKKMPPVPVRPDAVVMRGGLDIATAALFAKPGTLRLAYNYEPFVGGGYERIGGIERFDGRPRPSDASYIMLRFTLTGVAPLVGETINGLTSGATGVVIYILDDMIAVTRVTGNFAVETLREGVTAFGASTDIAPAIDGFLDNQMYALAATSYRADILGVPGSGRMRGVYVLNDVLYAWRNNAGGTAMEIYKSSVAGWTLVPLLYEVSFTVGTLAPAENDVIAQGATTATIKRIVLESGSWAGGTAAGRYICTAPAGGSFGAGAFTTASQGTIPAAAAGVYHGTAITLAPDGVVRAVRYNFTASIATRRLYGCDGVNREFEFDGTILVPLATGMASVRANAVAGHKLHLAFGYRGSVQVSGIGEPYKWTPLTGAAELGTGDVVSDLVSVGGNEVASALMVLCENSLFVLYGNSTADFKMIPLSSISGCSAGSAQDVGGVLALDSGGFVRYPPTQAFGNFAWNSVSLQIDQLARGQSAACSVFAAPTNRYRVFFADGTSLTGSPSGKNFEWTATYVGRTILCADHAEIAGNARTFYGDSSGMVYEADVGRSFDGDEIEYAIRTNELAQASPSLLKQYRILEIESKAASAFTVRVAAEFTDADQEIDQAQETTLNQYGSGLYYDISNYDESYWDVGGVARKRFTVEGQGTSISYIVAGLSDSELPHILQALTTTFSMRRLAR
jgi:hypothetical protein